MKTLNQEELFQVSGGNDEAVEVPAEVPVEATAEVVVAEPTFLQVAGAYLSKLALGCCS